MQSVVPFFIFSQSEVAHPSVLDFHDFNTIEDYRPAPWGRSLPLVYDISGVILHWQDYYQGKLGPIKKA